MSVKGRKGHGQGPGASTCLSSGVMSHGQHYLLPALVYDSLLTREAHLRLVFRVFIGALSHSYDSLLT